jgi:Ca-activated chloride channel family protein
MAMRAAAFVAAALLAALPLGAQQTFRSGVDLVRVDALVTDVRTPIAGLTGADFELRDNGVLQSIDSAQLESLPLSVILVLDTSGSVAGNKMWHLREAVDLVIAGLHPGDRAALVTFSHRVWLRTPLVSDFTAVRSMMASTDATGGTSLRDAVYAALAISDVEDSRPLLVVFSDGLDNMSWMSTEIVQQAARRANAVVYGVAVAASVKRSMRGLGSAARIVTSPDYQKGQTDFLATVAATTGGRLIKADTTNNLPQAFDEILREFRTRYVIAYSPRGVDTPGWHRIDVKVKGRRAEVHARAGYQK